MAKFGKLSVPHHVKERLRHRRIQSILEHIGKHVPKRPSDRKETKAKCLRRVLLYMKFLLQKQADIGHSRDPPQKDPNLVNIPIPKSTTKKKKAISSKKVPVSKIKCRRAQIVFLKKFTDTSSPEKEISPSTSIPEPKVIGNQLMSTSCIQDEEKPYSASSKNSVSCLPLEVSHSMESSVEAAFAVGQSKDVLDTLPSINSFSHYSNKKSSTLTYTDEDCKDDLDSHKREAYLLYPKIDFLQEKDDSMEYFMTNSLNAIKKENSEIDPFYSNDSAFPSRPCKKELSNYSETREECEFVKSSQFPREWTSEFSGRDAIFHDSHAFVPVPKETALQSIASENDFPSGIRNHSNYAQIENNFSGIPGVNPSLCSFSDDQDSFFIDIFSSGESANIASSNEWISNDETDGSLTRNNVFESPECYPAFNMSPRTNLCAQKDPLQSFCELQNSMHHNLTFADSNILSKLNADCNEQASYYDERHIHNRCGFNYLSKAQDHPDNSPISSQGSFSSDLMNFHTSAPEYYLHHNYDNMESYPRRAVERIPRKEFSIPNDGNVNFYETLESSDYFSYPQPGGSCCGDPGGVKIKQETLDVLPHEEISYSLNNLNWCHENGCTDF